MLLVYCYEFISTSSLTCQSVALNRAETYGEVLREGGQGEHVVYVHDAVRRRDDPLRVYERRRALVHVVILEHSRPWPSTLLRDVSTNHKRRNFRVRS